MCVLKSYVHNIVLLVVVVIDSDKEYLSNKRVP